MSSWKRKVFPTARCDTNLLSEDRRAFVGSDLDQTHANRAAARHDCVAVRGLESNPKTMTVVAAINQVNAMA